MSTQRFRHALILILFASAIASCTGGGDDDTASSAPGDDDSAMDDSLKDDDAADDDTQAADDTGDDAVDDTDDDTTDDADIYADLNPMGAQLKDLFGIVSHMSGGGDDWQRDFEIGKMLEMGVMRVRRDFAWDGIEPNNDEWHWEYYDTFYNEAQEHGLKFIALLDYGVSWAMPGGSESEIPPADWADFASHVAARYCDTIKHYEIWNEENLSGRFWHPRNDPQHYGEMLAASYTAIKAVCPDALVIFGGLSTMDIPDSLYLGAYPFFDRVAESNPDVCDSFDVMAIHPYSFLQQMQPEFYFKLLFFDYPNLPGQTDDIRERMTNAGCGQKPVWWTEFGWPSIIIGDDNQARFLARGLLLGAMKGIEGMYWYTFWDGHGGSPFTENYFGIYGPPDNPDPDMQVPKPSFTAYKTLSGILGETQFAGDLSAKLGLAENVYALAFTEGASRIVVALWDGSHFLKHTSNVSLPAPAGTVQITVTRQDGTVDPGPWSDPLNLVLTGDVLYVEFDF